MVDEILKSLINVDCDEFNTLFPRVKTSTSKQLRNGRFCKVHFTHEKCFFE